MENNDRTNEVILLFDTYSIESQDLHTSFKLTGQNYLAVVIEDDGFLPEDVISVYGYFLGDFKNADNIPGKPRYFNQIVVPEYWEISGTNSSGKIHDMNKERGRIFYAEPKHKRYVKVVDWLDDSGVVRSSDHYNCYGALYARTVFNAKGQKVNKSYFSVSGKEIIVENYVTGDIILNDGDTVNVFHTKLDFVLYFMGKVADKDSRIYFNSLSTPFFVSQRMNPAVKKDILFWQEPERNDIPGNMTIILEGKSNRTERIMVQKEAAYNKLIALGAPKQIVRKLGYVYPVERANMHRLEALICTNSDRIEKLEEIVESLPEMQFHIVALTEMSSKLMSMDGYDNVNLYPNVKMDVLDELFKNCDFYFDINHGNEIVSAVRRAFLNNQLILSFNETVHNRNYVAAEHIFDSKYVNRMIAELQMIMMNPQLIEENIKLQHAAALAEQTAAYKFNFTKGD